MTTDAWAYALIETLEREMLAAIMLGHAELAGQKATELAHLATRYY
jgi:hypothetical protein